MSTLNMNLCWICKKNEIDSREHIFKKSLLGKTKNFYHVPLSEKPIVTIQGPGSNKMKYKANICAVCNNQLTQGFDMAYDKLYVWFKSKIVKPRIKNILTMNLSQVFGENYKSTLEDFYCYCAKSLGCRIIDAGILLPEDFPNPLTKENLRTLSISLCLTRPFGYKGGQVESFVNILGKGDLLGYLQEEGDEVRVLKAIWWENIGFLQISYWLGYKPNALFGNELNDNEVVYKIVNTKMDLKKVMKKMRNIL